MKLFLYVLLIACLVADILESKTILITGGAGFIGATLTEKLIERKDTVIVVDNFVSLAGAKAQEYNGQKRKRIAQLQIDHLDRLHVYENSITDMQALDVVFSRHAIDVVCHLAAHAGVRASVENPQKFVDTNITGTINVLEMIKKYKIAHCVLASSSSVYGDTDQLPFTEDQMTDTQTSVYGVTKKSLELMAQVYTRQYGFSATCLRFFTVYGPYGRFDMAPFIFMDAIHNEKPITIYGDGMVVRDFTYVDDIVDGIIRALDTPLGFQIVNLGTTNTIVLNDFIVLLECLIGKDAQKIYKDAMQADVRMTWADVTKAQHLLGYEPSANLISGLQKMYEWYVNFFNQNSEERCIA